MENTKLLKFAGNNLLSELYKKVGNKDAAALLTLRAELAAATGASQVLLGRWLNNTGQPTVAQLVALAQVLGVSMDSLCRLG